MVDRRCPVSEQTPEEEILNVITHGIGILMACIGFLHIWDTYQTTTSTWNFIVLAVFGFAWVALYCTSTAYHAVKNLEHKAFLRILDHCAIFIVIAASYGPYVVNVLKTQHGHIVWALSWLIAFAGCIFKFRSEYRYHVQATWLYLIQGYMVALTLPTMLAEMSKSSLFWLSWGGVLLTGGAYFYIRDDVKYNHCVWHICVVVGSVGFYKSIIQVI